MFSFSRFRLYDRMYRVEASSFGAFLFDNGESMMSALVAKEFSG